MASLIKKQLKVIGKFINLHSSKHEFNTNSNVTSNYKWKLTVFFLQINKFKYTI